MGCVFKIAAESALEFALGRPGLITTIIIRNGVYRCIVFGYQTPNFPYGKWVVIDVSGNNSLIPGRQLGVRLSAKILNSAQPPTIGRRFSFFNSFQFLFSNLTIQCDRIELLSLKFSFPSLSQLH